MKPRKSTKRRNTRLRRLTAIANAAEPAVSVIIPAANERKTIRQVIYEARHVHPETEVIVVVNGSTDGTERLAEEMGARVVVFPEVLGHDVGRAIGAREAKGRILLFTDADIVIPAAKLRPFVEQIDQGADIALNRYLGPVKTKRPHPVILAKHALNAMCSRPDLRGFSLTTVPHAMSREALEKVGMELLVIPPKAMAAAVHLGMNIKLPCRVDVGRSNPRRRTKYRVDPVQTLILGDHLEALGWLLEAVRDNESGIRIGMTDLQRNRQRVR
ncbi:glycosyltransferase family 2 protein [Paenibacillus turpanensis]|uniref:glycosyltransferase family 2 protein n=1 Tax=Paenibacillus turpanensis TaxID=2689078 RepID=UPI00140A8ABA|nr:glycosyltransferase family 2 protein [Paenibacillus turpanensis]